MSEEQDEHLNHDEVMSQLVVIKDRLETYPLANHEVICLKDCMLLLIRTIAGERVSELNLTSLGGGIMENSTNQGNSEFIGGEMRVGGIEIAPGVVQYPAASESATMDVESSQKELNSSLRVTKTPISDMPKAAPGSLMEQALINEGKNDEIATNKTSAGEQAAIAEIQEQSKNAPKGIPSPTDTILEITS